MATVKKSEKKSVRRSENNDETSQKAQGKHIHRIIEDDTLIDFILSTLSSSTLFSSSSRKNKIV